MDKGLVTGNTYYYKVRTFCTSGGKKIYSDYSDPASMQVLPGKPSIQVVAANYNTITVSWKKVEGVMDIVYIVQQRKMENINQSKPVLPLIRFLIRTVS